MLCLVLVSWYQSEFFSPIPPPVVGKRLVLHHHFSFLYSTLDWLLVKDRYDSGITDNMLGLKYSGKQQLGTYYHKSFICQIVCLRSFKNAMHSYDDTLPNSISCSVLVLTPYNLDPGYWNYCTAMMTLYLTVSAAVCLC